MKKAIAILILLTLILGLCGIASAEGAVYKVRTLMGATNPADAAPGTIRGDFGLTMDENVIHGSDSTTSAEREIGVFFG